MNSKQKLEAVIAAQKAGEALPQFWTAPQTTNRPLNNLNSQSSSKFKPSLVDRYSSSTPTNLNVLKAKGVPRLELYTDEILKKAMGWGVEEWLVQVCIRDYGIYTVKGQINRIYNIPDGYFKPKYGPIPNQRGRLFNTEMQKLKQQTVQGA